MKTLLVNASAKSKNNKFRTNLFQGLDSRYISTPRYYKYSYLNVCNVVMADYVTAINIVARAAVKQEIVAIELGIATRE